MTTTTICQACDKKAKWLYGNKKKGMWLCDDCDWSVETTGKLPEKVIEKLKAKLKK